MILGAFRFIEESTFDRAVSAVDTGIFHDANQLWALAVAVRCSTACAGRADTVEMAWKIFEYHLHADLLRVGTVKQFIMRSAGLYFNNDYTAVLQEARRLFRIALDKVVPDEDWLQNFNFFRMTPAQA